MKKWIAIFVLLPFLAFSQKIDNHLHGYFEAKKDNNLYGYFAFDGNGKVEISGFNTEDFFVKEDSVFVFTDKTDVFIFKLKNNQLKGIETSFVKGETWIKKDTLVENKRKNDEAAQKNAELLHQYYLKTRKNKNFAFLFDEKENTKYENDLFQLCNDGLIKACKEEFALKLINLSGGIEGLMSKKKAVKIEPNEELEQLSKKIIAAGDVDGHTLLASYYQMMGNDKEAKKQLDIAVEKGSLKAAFILIEMETAEIEKELNK